MVNRKDFFVTWMRPFLAEFFGQLLFVFCHCSTVRTIGTAPGGGAGNPLLPAISDGFIIAVLVMVIGHVSGAHCNFAVTIAIFLAGRIKLIMVPVYLLAQVLGSLAGGGLALVAHGKGTGAFALGEEASIGQGVLMEVMMTSVLVVSVLVAAVELSSITAAFTVGFSVVVGILAGFSVSGGCMNPTLSLGPAVVSGQWDNYWIYWVAPILGSALTALIFRLVLAQDDYRVVCKDGRNLYEDKTEREKESEYVNTIAFSGEKL